MKLLNSILLSVFVREGENENAIVEKLKSFIPVDFDAEKIFIKRQTAEGFEDKKIVVLEIELEREKHTNIFLKTLNSGLDAEQKELLIRQAGSRLDEDFNFFIRFDKEKLLNENKYWVTDSGSCFHIKMNIACFPRKMDIALGIIQNIFK